MVALWYKLRQTYFFDLVILTENVAFIIILLSSNASVDPSRRTRISFFYYQSDLITYCPHENIKIFTSFTNRQLHNSKQAFTYWKVLIYHVYMRKVALSCFKQLPLTSNAIFALWIKVNFVARLLSNVLEAFTTSACCKRVKKWLKY